MCVDGYRFLVLQIEHVSSDNVNFMRRAAVNELFTHTKLYTDDYDQFIILVHVDLSKPGSQVTTFLTDCNRFGVKYEFCLKFQHKKLENLLRRTSTLLVEKVGPVVNVYHQV